jgi:hypothetical protein
MMFLLFGFHVIAGATSARSHLASVSQALPCRPSHTLFLGIQQVTSLLKLWLEHVNQTGSPLRLAENQA